MSNQFVLKQREIEVEYTAGIDPSFPALIYKKSSSVEASFKPAEIATAQTALGTLVSVPLLASTDTGGDRFGFLLPDLDVPQGESGQFTTVGVYERLSGPEPGQGIPPSWRAIELHGTAQTVMVPQ
jgi:hypothetical protein